MKNLIQPKTIQLIIFLTIFTQLISPARAWSLGGFLADVTDVIVEDIDDDEDEDIVNDDNEDNSTNYGAVYEYTETDDDDEEEYTYTEDEDEDEAYQHTTLGEVEVAQEHILNTPSATPGDLVADTLENQTIIENLTAPREARYEDLEYFFCFFCVSEKSGQLNMYFKDEKDAFNGTSIDKDGLKTLFHDGIVKMTMRFYPNTEQLKKKINYILRDDKLEYVQSGLTTLWHENGQMKAQGQMKEDKQSGTWKGYHENGQLEYVDFFIDGISNGIYETWFDNGNKKSIDEYKNDKVIGESLSFHKNGQLRQKLTYNEDGKPEGDGMAWHDNGTISKKFTQARYGITNKDGSFSLINDKSTGYIGLSSKYYDDGQQLASSSRNSMGNKQGLQKKWHNNGTLSEEEFYFERFPRNNRTQLEYFTKYFTDSKKEEEFKWSADDKFSHWTKWYKNGNPRSLETHNATWFKDVADLPDPEQYQVEWYPNGIKKSEKFYFSGKLMKHLKWGRDGSVLVDKNFGFNENMVIKFDDDIVKTMNVSKNTSHQYQQATDQLNKGGSIQPADTKKWDDGMYTVADTGNSVYMLVYKKDKTRFRVGDPAKLSHPVIKSLDEKLQTRTIVSYRHLLNKTIALKEETDDYLNGRFFKMLSQGKVETHLFTAPLKSILFHLKRYLGTYMSAEERKQGQIAEKIILANKQIADYELAIEMTRGNRGQLLQYTFEDEAKLLRQLEGAIIRIQKAIKMTHLDNLFGLDLKKIGIERFHVPLNDDEQLVRLNEVLLEHEILVNKILKEDMIYGTLEYAPFKKDLLPSFFDIPLHLPDNGITSKSLSTPITIYTHDYEPKDDQSYNVKKQLQMTSLDYSNSEHAMDISKVQYITKKGKVIGIKGFYKHPAYDTYYLAFDMPINDGFINGEYKEFYKPSLVDGLGNITGTYQSNISKSVSYQNGKIHGSYRVFSEPKGKVEVDPSTSTKVLKEIKIKDRFGNGFNWSQSKMVSEANYKHGKLHGKFMHVYPQSMKPSVTGEYKDGLKTGLWQRFDYNNLTPGYAHISEIFDAGTIINAHKVINNKDLDFIDGIAMVDDIKFDGNAISYFPNGKKNTVSPYSIGQKNGKQFSFYPNGYPKEMITYADGTPNGLSRSWDKDGYIVSEANYNNGFIDGEALDFFSLEEMIEFGHVFTDVAWNTSGLDMQTTDIKRFLNSGAGNFKKHADYVVAIYEKGYLFTDIAYSVNIMSHPSVGFSTHLPIKSKSIMSKGEFSGLRTDYYPNGHIQQHGEMLSGKRTGDWNKFHAWRPNSDNSGNLLMSTHVYQNGELVTDISHTTDLELNTYGNKVFDHSYALDMEYVTGKRQVGICFECATIKSKPAFVEGFELRRNIMTGSLPKSIAKVAQTQTIEKIVSKDSNVLYKSNGFIGLTITATSSGDDKETVAFQWDDEQYPKYDFNSITGGYVHDLEDGNDIYFSKYSSKGVSDLSINYFNRFGKKSAHIGFNLEKYLAQTTKEIASSAISNSTVINDKTRHPSEFKINTLLSGLCLAKSSEQTRLFNRGRISGNVGSGITDSYLRGLDRDLAKIYFNNKNLMNVLFAKSLYEPLRDDNLPTFLDDPQPIDLSENNFKAYFDVLNGWAEFDEMKYAKKLDHSKIGIDKGFLFTTVIEKSTGNDYTGWSTGNDISDPKLTHLAGGTVDKYYLDGFLLREIFYRSSGKKYLDRSYKDKKITGPVFTYPEEGKTIAMFYLNGQKEMFSIGFKDGNVTEEAAFKHGYPTGYATTYWDNGNIKHQVKHSYAGETEEVNCNENGSRG